MKRKEKEPLRLHLGLATEMRLNPDAMKPGFKLVDHTKDADIRFDLLKFPWSLENEVVAEVISVGYFCFIPAKSRSQFMDEMYRVMQPAAKANIIVPYWSSMRAVQDYLYEWPPWCETSFLFFDKQWRKANRLEWRDLKCDFELGPYGYTADAETSNRNDDARQFWVKHYINSASDLNMTLTKRKAE
jgi:hypothetical protein